MAESTTITQLVETESGQNSDQLLISRGGNNFYLELGDLKPYSVQKETVDFFIPESTGNYVSGEAVSESFEISGLDLPQIIVASGQNAQVNINNQGYVLQDYVKNGDSVVVKMDSSTVSAGQVTCDVTIGATTKQFTGTNDAYTRFWQITDSSHQPFVDFYFDNTGNMIWSDNGVSGVYSESNNVLFTSTGYAVDKIWNLGYLNIATTSGENYYKGWVGNRGAGVFIGDTGINGLSGKLQGIENTTGEFTFISAIRPFASAADHSCLIGIQDLSDYNDTSYPFYSASVEGLTFHGSRVSRRIQSTYTSYGDYMEVDNEKSYIISYSYKNGTGKFYTNGELVGTATFTSNINEVPKHVFIGWTANGTALSSNIYACIGLTGCIEQDEIRKWEGYLIDRFGLQDSIFDVNDQVHIFKNTKPQV